MLTTTTRSRIGSELRRRLGEYRRRFHHDEIVAQPSGANTATRLDLSGVTDDRRKDTTHVALGFDFKRGNSRSAGWRAIRARREHRGGFQDNTVGESDLRLTRIGWTPSARGWIRRRGHSRRLRSELVRPHQLRPQRSQANNITGSLMSGKTEEYTARVDARYALGWKLPTFSKSA